MMKIVRIRAVMVPTGFRGPGYVEEAKMYIVDGGPPSRLESVQQDYWTKISLASLEPGEETSGHKRENGPRYI